MKEKLRYSLIMDKTTRQDKQENRIFKHYKDFPGGTVVKNLLSNAGDTSLIPAQRTKILHAMGQLSPCATTTEPTFWSPSHNQRETTTKDPACCNTAKICCSQTSKYFLKHINTTCKLN